MPVPDGSSITFVSVVLVPINASSNKRLSVPSPLRLIFCNASNVIFPELNCIVLPPSVKLPIVADPLVTARFTVSIGLLTYKSAKGVPL